MEVLCWQGAGVEAIEGFMEEEGQEGLLAGRAGGGGRVAGLEVGAVEVEGEALLSEQDGWWVLAVGAEEEWGGELLQVVAVGKKGWSVMVLLQVAA